MKEFFGTPGRRMELQIATSVGELAECEDVRAMHRPAKKITAWQIWLCFMRTLPDVWKRRNWCSPRRLEVSAAHLPGLGHGAGASPQEVRRNGLGF